MLRGCVRGSVTEILNSDVTTSFGGGAHDVMIVVFDWKM